MSKEHAVVLEGDPIAGGVYRIWVAQGWDEAAPGAAVVTSIFRAEQILAQHADRVLAPLDLTFARFQVLSIVFFSGGELSLARISESAQIHQTSITNLVDKLERAGMIERVPHPTDRRSTIARITTQGKSLARKAHRRMNSQLYANLGLPDEEVRDLIDLLAKLRGAQGDVVDQPDGA